MPMRREDYCADWEARSRFVRLIRSRGKCEQCGRPNGEVIVYHKEHPSEWRLATGGELEDLEVRELGYRYTKVVLTTAHMDHDRSNNSLFNLRALCQRCHLHHDRHQHARSRKYGRYHSRGQGQFEFPR